MSKPPPPRPRETVAARFQREIEAAESDGVARSEMVVRLTLSDESRLRRDPAVAVSDIRFSGGVMRFLDVRVQPGGTSESRLLLEPETEAG